MSHQNTIKRRDFLKGAGCTLAASGFGTVLPSLGLMSTAIAQSVTGYKAVVCIFLDGGNDAWNMLIPTNDTAGALTVNGRSPLTGQQNSPFGWYVTSRGGLFDSTLNASRLGIPVAGTPGVSNGINLPTAYPLAGSEFALNPFTGELRNIRAPAGRLSFLSNIGPLVEPVRKSGFNTYQRPPQLYSHNDQTSLWQIGSGSNLTSPNGWGGMIAGRVATPSGLGLPPVISLAGQTRFLVGLTPTGGPVSPYRLSTNANNPATSLSNYGSVAFSGGTATRSFNAGNAEQARWNALQDLINEAYPHVYSNQYRQTVDRSLDLSETINAQIANIPAGAPGSPDAIFATQLNAIPNTGIGNQLRQIARMIRISRAGAGPINANRQIFFARTGGYDTHDGQITNLTQPNGHHNLLSQLSGALVGFNNTLGALNGVAGYAGIFDEVLTIVISEFGRTVNSNGNGTDHAWGSVGIAMGGPVVGAPVVGQVPPQVLGLTDGNWSSSLPYLGGECFNRGEFLPRIAVSQFGATVARWMGVADADLPAIFPAIDNMQNPRNGAQISFASRTIPGLLAGV